MIRAMICVGSMLLTVGSMADDRPNFPGNAWQTKTTQQVGVNAAALDEFAKAVSGDGVVIRDGYLVKTWGQPDRRAD